MKKIKLELLEFLTLKKSQIVFGLAFSTMILPKYLSKLSTPQEIVTLKKKTSSNREKS
jgi:hypothetical protein